ncbi:MAG: ATP-binding protein [Bacillota bacterium]
MRLEKLDIKGFGKFNNLIVKFDKGLNMVFGANEAGKSTILWFIKGMLYSLKGGRTFKDGSIPPQKRYKPWYGSDYRGSMTYTLDNGSYFIIERNFNDNTVRIYDSSFNDISSSFDQSRDKGPLFALKHLGINESCFDKTVFIGQLDTRINAAESRELLDKLTNISQTGFEDVSLDRAREALKEALINYAGTDKTTTRPLNTVSLKLDELKDKRNSLIERRESLFTVEEKVKGLNHLKKSLEEKKSAMTFAKEVLNHRKKIEDYKKQRKELVGILKEVSGYEKERDILSERIDEYNKTEEQYKCYFKYNDENNEDISLQYGRYIDLLRDTQKISERLLELKGEVGEIEVYLGEFKAFNSLKDNIEEIVLELDSSIDALELEKEKSNTGELDEAVKAAAFKDRLVKSGVISFILVGALLAAAGIFIPFAGVGIYAAGIPFILSIVLIFIGSSYSKQLKSLLNRKNETDLFIKNINDEIKLRRERLTGIFNASGVKNIGEFLKKKTLYDTKVIEFTRLNDNIINLERNMELNANLSSTLKASITEKLAECKIITSHTEEIKEEYIEKYKDGLDRYRKALNNSKQDHEKLMDLNKYLESLYVRASSVCQQELKSRDDIMRVLSKIKNNIDSLYESIEINTYRIKAVHNSNGYDVSSLNELSEKIVDDNILAAEKYVEESMFKIQSEINEIAVEIGKNEAIIENSGSIYEELEKVDEEIEELEEKRIHLEDTAVCLKTALNVLDESSSDIKKDFVPLLNKKMSNIVAGVTKERYKDIRADNGFMLRTPDPNTGDIVSASFLSGGTIDQIYLALRIALAQVIESQGEKLPFFMDEIFAQYDDERVLETFKLLGEMSNERQIIIFTCKEREVEAAKSIFSDRLNIIKLG